MITSTYFWICIYLIEKDLTLTHFCGFFYADIMGVFNLIKDCHAYVNFLLTIVLNIECKVLLSLFYIQSHTALLKTFTIVLS